MKYTIIWNENKTEGIILQDRKDITYASTGEYVDYSDSTFGVSTLADAFRATFDGTDQFETQVVEI